LNEYVYLKLNGFSENEIDGLVEQDLVDHTIDLIKFYKGQDYDRLYSVADYFLAKNRQYEKKQGQKIVEDKATKLKAYDIVDNLREVTTLNFFKRQKKNNLQQFFTQAYPNKKVAIVKTTAEFENAIKLYVKK
jgi:hypothetical protein